MNLTPHFTAAEFTRSSTATRLGIDNTIPTYLIPTVMRTAEMLERIREHLSKLAGREIPISITSGYRCEQLNRAVGSGSTSDHLRGMAVDFEAPSFGNPTDIASALAPMVGLLGIGQLINEYPDRDGWVHVSTRIPEKTVNRIITITGRGTSTGILSS